jgi:uncharacterized protein VirK/YbjX
MYIALPDRLLRQTLLGDVTLHEIYKGGNRYALTICLSRSPSDKEGELSIHLEMDGDKLYNLSFSIVPGWVVKSAAAETALITRLQGMPGINLTQIRLAIKALNGINPRALVFAALEGIAAGLGVGEIAAVCATNQTSYCEEFAASFRNCYDDFFTDRGLDKTSEPLAKSSSAADDSEGRKIFPCWRYLAMQGNSVWAIF